MTIIPEDTSHLVFLAEDNSKSHEQLRDNRDRQDLDLDVFCVLDLEGHFQKINAQYEKVLGFSLEELKSCCFLDLVPEEDFPFTQESVQRVATPKNWGILSAASGPKTIIMSFWNGGRKKAENTFMLRLGT